MYTGLRPSDILQITVDQVDTENRTIQTYMPKVKSWIKIPYHEILDDILIARKKEVKKWTSRKLCWEQRGIKTNESLFATTWLQRKRLYSSYF